MGQYGRPNLALAGLLVGFWYEVATDFFSGPGKQSVMCVSSQFLISQMIFDVMVHLDAVCVVIEGQGRSFTVIGLMMFLF